MKRIGLKKLTKRRTLGIGVMILGAIVMFAPVFVGGWIIALLGIALIASGLLQFVGTFRSDDQAKSLLSYAAGVTTTLLGFVLFLSPNLAGSGLRFAITLFFGGIYDNAFAVRCRRRFNQERGFALRK